jgi:hypothetical protein
LANDEVMLSSHAYHNDIDGLSNDTEYRGGISFGSSGGFLLYYRIPSFGLRIPHKNADNATSVVANDTNWEIFLQAWL